MDAVKILDKAGEELIKLKTIMKRSIARMQKPKSCHSFSCSIIEWIRGEEDI